MSTPRLSIKISALESVCFESAGKSVAISVTVAGVNVFSRTVSADVAQAVADAAHCHAAAAKSSELKSEG